MNKAERKCLDRIAKEVSYWKSIDTTNNLALDGIVLGALGALSNVITSLYGVNIDRVHTDMVMLQDLGLTIRTLNGLLTEGINTLPELKELMAGGDYKVLKLPNMGKKSLAEIKFAIREHAIKNYKASE